MDKRSESKEVNFFTFSNDGETCCSINAPSIWRYVRNALSTCDNSKQIFSSQKRLLILNQQSLLSGFLLHLLQKQESASRSSSADSIIPDTYGLHLLLTDAEGQPEPPEASKQTDTFKNNLFPPKKKNSQENEVETTQQFDKPK